MLLYSEKKEKIMLDELLFEELLEASEKELAYFGIKKVSEKSVGLQNQLFFKNSDGDTLRVVSTRISSEGRYPQFVDKFYFNGIQSNPTTPIATF